MTRAYVEGLRRADPITLAVLTQDLIRKPLVKLDPRAICDLLALSESEAISGELARDLRKFKDQMLREVSDLPDGLRLGDFLAELIEVGAGRVPASLRTAALERSLTDETPETVGHRARLVEAFEAQEPDSVTVTQEPEVEVTKTRAPKPRSQSGSARGVGRGAAPVKDVQRATWIRDDVLERLSHYGLKGIKQSVLVAGAIHRSPYSNLTPSEVVGVLKVLKLADKVDLSKGRWSIRTAR